MEIKIKSPKGVKLLTEQKYCVENIDVVPELQNKTVTPSDTQQVVTPDAEFAGLGSVTVEPGTVTADATATADDIRLGKTAYGADGKMTGTLSDYDGSSEPTSGKSLFAKLVEGNISEVTAEDLKGVIAIRPYAFAFATRLTSIIIPDNVSLGNHMFYQCTALESVILPKGINLLPTEIFSVCSNLKTIKIPDSITIIDSSAFSSSGIVSIIVPNSVTTIYRNAFYQCKNLNNITLPNNLTIIYEHLFDRCTNLQSIRISNSVTDIENSAFYLCRSLSDIVIGTGIANIGIYVFANCGTNTTSGTTYTILATTPPTIQSNTFYNAKINKIIVPVGTSAAYKAATNWSTLADYIEEATE